VDAGLFDDAAVGLAVADQAVEMAVMAWEVASCWSLEPVYARELAARFIRMVIL